MEEKKPLFTFKRTHMNILITGIVLIFCFFLIYIAIVIKTKQINFYSLFYHSIKHHIFLTVLSGFHVSLLGFGILFNIYAFFNLTLYIKCYKDKFIVSMYMQKNKTINFSKIDRVSLKIYYLNYDNLFNKYDQKECRVFIHNPEHIFYFSYKLDGYFDDVVINLKKTKENMDERCVADRNSIFKILEILKNKYNISVPYLPKEEGEKA